MDALIYHRNTCRLCDSPDIDLVLEMTPCPPVDAYIPRTALQTKQDAFPMDLYLCRACGHGQLLDVVSPQLLFGSYIYTTSSSPGLVDYFRDYAAQVRQQLQLPPSSLVVDIGSNDGALLRFFKEAGHRVLGVDPARTIAEKATASGIETRAEFFTRAVAERIRSERGPAHLVTANNVFAHSDQLGDMADGIRHLLAPDGVFVFEVSYLLDMVENMVFDFIYHEHLSHHSVKPMRQFMDRHGLHLFGVERTPSKGGTIRCFAQVARGPRAETASVDEFIRREEASGLYNLETYRAYTEKIQQAKSALRARVQQLQAEGKTLAAYGASATSTVLIYHFDLGNSLRFIVDDNPVRQNRFSPGYHIPIVSSQALADEKPDAVIILVWRFADMIVKRNGAYLDQGGHFIIPLPALRVI